MKPRHEFIIMNNEGSFYTGQLVTHITLGFNESAYVLDKWDLTVEKVPLASLFLVPDVHDNLDQSIRVLSNAIEFQTVLFQGVSFYAECSFGDNYRVIKRDLISAQLQTSDFSIDGIICDLVPVYNGTNYIMRARCGDNLCNLLTVTAVRQPKPALYSVYQDGRNVFANYLLPVDDGNVPVTLVFDLKTISFKGYYCYRGDAQCTGDLSSYFLLPELGKNMLRKW